MASLFSFLFFIFHNIILATTLYEHYIYIYIYMYMSLSRILVKWLACLIHSQKLAGIHLIPPALLYMICYSETYFIYNILTKLWYDCQFF